MKKTKIQYQENVLKDIQQSLYYLNTLCWIKGDYHQELLDVNNASKNYLDSLQTNKFAPKKRSFQELIDSVKNFQKSVKEPWNKRFLREFSRLLLIIRRESNKKKDYTFVMNQSLEDFPLDHEIRKASFYQSKKEIKLTYKKPKKQS